ncbi:acetyl-coenzyme A synthetase [Acrasis kona]|uniref:Acetyl-coenzyme A synthetase n=1 Tax=Acrasis kona TaxID=1008807 RepID=A0AAW2Z6S0_9EUKA
MPEVDVQSQEIHHQDQHSEVFNPPAHISERAWVKSYNEYKNNYDASMDEQFYAGIAREFHWEKPFTQILDYNFSRKKGRVFVEWFKDGTTNVAYNCLDRNLNANRGDKIAFFYEGNEPTETNSITYKQLHEQVVDFSSVLRNMGVRRGHCVAIYMPMVVEIVVAMLACARIGAIHSVVFGGFSAESLANRILDSQARVLITTDGVFRGPKPVELKKCCDDACRIVNQQLTAGYNGIEKMVVYQRLGAEHLKLKEWVDGRDIWWHDAIKQIDRTIAPPAVEWMNAEDPLFMLYTSGSTGKPKGLVHTTGGYMVTAATTFKYVFDYHDQDIYFCTADCGWITGHTYLCYGPLLNGATSVLFEGIPTYPDESRCWRMIDRYNVTQFYTAPTAIRALMRFGDDKVTQTSTRNTLRILGSVGEPINPEAWMWYHRVVGNSNCAIVDTYWQTETGGIMITSQPGAVPTKPGSASVPFYGVVPAVMRKKSDQSEDLVLDNTDEQFKQDEFYEESQVEAEGYLVIKRPWPGLARTIYGDHGRYEETYFSMFDGYYATGDGCRRDKDGYYWLTGRIDDVLNVSGHRIGTAEVESALVGHKSIAEAAVVPMPHEIKGQGIYAYVTTKEGIVGDEALRAQLKSTVRVALGPIATPDVIHFTPSLPKTRSGKIMRRILRKIAEGLDSVSQLGDVSTLADPSVVDMLLKNK